MDLSVLLNTLSTNTIGSDFIYIVLVAVIIIQIFFTINRDIEIQKFRRIFKVFLDKEKGFIPIEILDNPDLSLKLKSIVRQVEPIDTKEYKAISYVYSHNDRSDSLQGIQDDVNSYLINNIGAPVNFGFIKDIIDRAVSLKEDEIANSISLPLLIGLGSTMLGVMIGFMSFPGLGQLNSSGINDMLVTDDFFHGINQLISSASLALVTSIVGLICTSYLSVFRFRNAKTQVEKDKNAQITRLQANLLPALLGQEDYGIVGLKNSLDNFSRNATSYLKGLKDTSKELISNIAYQEKVLEDHQLLINSFKSKEYINAMKLNGNILDSFERNVHIFNNFGELLKALGPVAENLKQFTENTNDITKLHQGISETVELNAYQTIALYEVIQVLTEYFKNLDSEIAKTALENVRNTTNDISTSLENFAGEIGKKADTIDFKFNTTSQNLQTILEEKLDKFKARADTTDSEIQKTTANLHDVINNYFASINQELSKSNVTLIEKIRLSEELLNQRIENVTNNFSTQALENFTDDLKEATTNLETKINDLTKSVHDSNQQLNKSISESLKITANSNPIERLPARDDKSKIEHLTETINDAPEAPINHEENISTLPETFLGKLKARLRKMFSILCCFYLKTKL